MGTPAHQSLLNGINNSNGKSYLHSGAWLYGTRLANGKYQQADKVAENLVPPAEDATLSNDAATSDGSSGVAANSMDAENTDGQSQKSPSSSTSDLIQLSLKAQVMETLISNMFSTISSLKNAYIQLQSAHVPYKPEKIQVADNAVIAELKRLSEVKHSYKESLAIISSGPVQEVLEPSGDIDSKVITLKSYEGIISNFYSEIQKKNAVVDNLEDMLVQTTLKKEKLERRVKRLEQRLAREPLAHSPADLASTPQLLEFVVLGASEASRNFTKLLTSFMKVAQWDLDAAANSIGPGVNYVRKTHQKFAFESYVNQRMLSGFESENFLVSSSLSTVLDPKNSQERFQEFKELRLADPVEMVNTNPKSLFAKYCLRKFLDLIHPKMEESFFGSMEHRSLILAGSHPSSQFYQSFLKLAKAMWILHNVAFLLEPNARIFQVQREADFSPLYMESIVQLGEQDLSTMDGKLKVGFTVMPGFLVEKTIIKCQVYIRARSVTETGRS